MRSVLRAFPFVALPFAFTACTTMTSKPSTSAAVDIPSAIATPGNSQLALTLSGSGLQNYECRSKADAPSGYDWVFVAPEAALKDKDVLVGKHYAGPTWEHGDGSKVAGKVVASAPAPQAGNIPWLLLQGMPAATPGTLSGVTYVQRVNTRGGVAPSDNCTASTIGTRQATRYTADYLFYKG